MSGNLVTTSTPGVLDEDADDRTPEDRTPEYALWDCMVAESDEIADIVHHDGAADKVPGMPPRPTWAHPSNDYVWPDGSAGYFSDHALVTSEAHPAIGTADTVWRSRCSVRLRKTSAYPDRTLVVFDGSSPKEVAPGRIEYQTASWWRFTPAEARLVAERLTAAADLAESA
ncbi:hypothetical protein nbrc107696_01490 [Gordonia spumicola]|uniref:Uncharacterized protein n=1 Tax=Gordonia spumicola TaxID=589161 RepID=A0A7I9V3C9_9ACTN|nr:hypothetical protein [Gordonia spumicola]GED99702.1 hypothetical protein nbrc107696_01490 [Gordonia spumicola]